MSGMMQMLLGAMGKFALLPSDITITDIVVSPSTATASFTLNSSGTYTCAGSIKPADGTWLKGTGTGSDYEARLTVVSGTFTTGTTGSWVSLGTSRQWILAQISVGSSSAAGTLEIRDPSSGVVFTSCNLTLNAEVN
jgi:hypothetical protein